MPLLDTTRIAADLAAIIGNSPVTVTFNGAAHSGLKSSLRRTDSLATEGMRAAYRMSVYLPVFASPPNVYDEVTIAGKVYLVLATGTDPLGVMLRLDLGEEHAAI